MRPPSKTIAATNQAAYTAQLKRGNANPAHLASSSGGLPAGQPPHDAPRRRLRESRPQLRAPPPPRIEYSSRALRPGVRLGCPRVDLSIPHSAARPPAAAMAAASVPPASSSGGWDFTCNFEVDYESEEHASIVYKTLAVDKELQPDKVKREMTLSGSKLAVHLAAVEARFLRASFSAFVDLMGLVTKLVEEYGAAKEGHS
ncbi:hypothetical protein GQ55_5G145800 [Panicum hallii var. hallii]|uniref:Uncharacterized protein n=1 Tax=Panicum hallii var. hallii TaxID=1504633 RepID=A0A2T7DGB1_9POAL|nr:hypothetical protein GQ55_5G145800 [Panicum hallii var. hallii]